MEHKHSVYDSDVRFVIDPVTRAVKNTSKKTTIIQFDHNSERVTFELPRYVEKHDMSLCNKVEVHYQNVDVKTREQKTGRYEIVDLDVDPEDENKVICSWLISNNATQLVGTLNFVVRFSCIESGIVTYSWNTLFNSELIVGTGFNASELFETEYVDIIEQWKESVMQTFHDDLTAWKDETATAMKAEVKAEFGQEIDVERKRIDNLVSGGTVDDAEVLDIRVDVHGKTHGSAGTAVREQVKGVYGMIDNLFEPGDSFISLCDADLSASDYSIVIKNGYVTVDGTLSASVRIKLTNKIAKGITNVPESWLTETAPFVVGQTYVAKAHHISGTVKSDNGTDKSTGVVVSARDAENNVLFSDTKGATTLTITASHAQLFLPFGVYDNAVFLPIIQEGETLTAPEDIKTRYLSDRVGVKNSHFANFDFAEMLKALAYTTVEEFSHTVLHEDNLDYYADNQGMCTDGENLYYSLRREVGDSGNTILKKYNLATNKVTLTVENHSYGHANGMAYIPHENALYVVKLDTAGTIFKVDADTLEYIAEFSLKDVLSTKVEWYMGVGAVAYDATREKIVFLLRGEEENDGRTRKGFAVFDKEMRFEKIIKTHYIPCFSYSGLATDKNFIYLTITNPHNDDGEWLIAYDWHGNEVYRTEISYFSHLEAQAVIGDTFYFSYNQPYNGAHIVECKPLATGSIYKTDVMAQYNLND